MLQGDISDRQTADSEIPHSVFIRNMQIVNTKMFQTIKHAKVNNNFIKSSQKLTGRLCSARRTNLICLQWGEQCREQTMLEMDFSGNNKTGNTIALMDKIMQKIHMKIYTSIFWLQLSLKLNYILTNNSFQSDLSTLIFFFKSSRSSMICKKKYFAHSWPVRYYQ